MTYVNTMFSFLCIICCLHSKPHGSIKSGDRNAEFYGHFQRYGNFFLNGSRARPKLAANWRHLILEPLKTNLQFVRDAEGRTF